MLNMKKGRLIAPFFIPKFTTFLRDCVAILVCHCGEPKPRAKRVGARQCVWQSLYYRRLMKSHIFLKILVNIVLPEVNKSSTLTNIQDLNP